MSLHIEFDELSTHPDINSNLITVLDLVDELGCVCYQDLKSSWSTNNRKRYMRQRSVEIVASDAIINYMKLRYMRYQHHIDHLDYCLYREEEILEEID